jgi:hypothetical protein
MIRLPDRRLSARTSATLTQYQNEIDAEADFETRVQIARERFEQRKRNAVFREVRNLLAEMCSGAIRCMYCEDSVADEIEHHKPQYFYPGEVFRWENLLYACGSCNGPKRNRFAILDTAGQMIHLREGVAAPPAQGSSVLLHPRIENPLEFLFLDIKGDTFRFVPVPGQNPPELIRADYTIKLLRLNVRDYLPRARRTAYIAYRALLSDFVQRRGDADEAARIVQAHRGCHHATVWCEMKRQRESIAEVRELFRCAPEALHW